MSEEDEYEDSDFDDEMETQAIVVDHGSYMMKAGFSDDDAPRAVFPTVVGEHRYKNNHPYRMFNVKDFYVAEEAESKRGVLKLHYPIDDLRIDWKHMRHIYEHVIWNALRISPDEHPFLMADNLLHSSLDQSKTCREQIYEILFEDHNIPFVCIKDQSLLALTASGKTSGIVIDSGNTTSIVPVYDGQIQKNNVYKLGVSADDLHVYMAEKLTQRGYWLRASKSSSDLYYIIGVKEKCCYIAKDFETEMKIKENALRMEYELPDGHIYVERERFQCTEALFNPSLINKECDGLGEALRKCINGFDDDNIKKELMQNILLCGGSSMFDGFVDRLYKEIGCSRKIYKSKVLIDGFYRNLNESATYKDVHDLTYKYCDESIKDPNRWIYAGNDRVQIDAPLEPFERIYHVWIGGSIYCQLEKFKSTGVSKEEYNEYGPNIANKRLQI